MVRVHRNLLVLQPHVARLYRIDRKVGHHHRGKQLELCRVFPNLPGLPVENKCGRVVDNQYVRNAAQPYVTVEPTARRLVATNRHLIFEKLVPVLLEDGVHKRQEPRYFLFRSRGSRLGLTLFFQRFVDAVPVE